jgi:hypothetical protein
LFRIVMARPPGPAESRPEDKLDDRATQQASVREPKESLIDWMARCCGP